MAELSMSLRYQITTLTLIFISLFMSHRRMILAFPEVIRVEDSCSHSVTKPEPELRQITKQQQTLDIK